MDLSIATILFQLIFLECILSIDNAAVLGAMATALPTDQRVPWPAPLRAIGRILEPVLGNQRPAALKVGLLGAYLGRMSMIFLTSLIIQNVWLQIIGALYLIYLAVRHVSKTFGSAGHEQETTQTDSALRGFWRIVLMIVLVDMAFSLDNVVAAVALSDRLWVVIVGIGIGMVVMRFAATLFTWLIAWEPMLESAAYLLLFAIGGKLLLEEYTHIEIGGGVQFILSMTIIILVVLFARVKLLQPIQIVFRPFVSLCVFLNRILSFIFALIMMPFDHKQRNTRQSVK